MSAHKSGTAAYLRWIIASEYYDGSVAGIGERAADGAAVWFRAVGWDDEQWRRVFAVTTVEPSLSERLVQNLEKVEPRKMPFWLPGPDSATPDVKKIWDEIVGAAASSDRWSLVEAHDLNEESVEHPVTPADVSQLVAAVRAGAVFEVRAASLTDGVLEQIRSQAG
jgi:hypothetical protein